MTRISSWGGKGERVLACPQGQDRLGAMSDIIMFEANFWKRKKGPTWGPKTKRAEGGGHFVASGDCEKMNKNSGKTGMAGIATKKERRGN